MSKIIYVIKNIVTNASKISDISKMGSKYLFKFKGFIWSIWAWSDDNTGGSGISLAYYPLAKDMSEIPVQSDFMVYSSDEYISEGFESGQVFNQLYTIIREKYFGVDKAFDMILKD